MCLQGGCCAALSCSDTGLQSTFAALSPSTRGGGVWQLVRTVQQPNLSVAPRQHRSVFYKFLWGGGADVRGAPGVAEPSPMLCNSCSTRVSSARAKGEVVRGESPGREAKTKLNGDVVMVPFKYPRLYHLMIALKQALRAWDIQIVFVADPIARMAF